MNTGNYSLRKRLLAIVMSLMMVLQMMPVTAFADEVESAVLSGTTSYTVEYVVYGETVDEYTDIVEEGSTVDSLPEAPESSSGAAFLGWYIGDSDVQFTASTPVTSDLTVKAVFDYWTLTFYNRDAEVYSTVRVEKGTSIGGKLPAVIAREDYNAYWAIGEIVAGGQGNEIKVTGAYVDSTTVPDQNLTIVPDYKKITYTVTFYESEDDTEALATRTVDVDTSYCLNDMPTVPSKSGYTSKWVYSGGDFDNTITITEDTKVWAGYDQNVFTVTFIVEGETYQTDSYFSGDTLTIPTEPVVDGKQFDGWFAGETEYTGGEPVVSDLVLNAGFINQYAVSFVIVSMIIVYTT